MIRSQQPHSEQISQSVNVIHSQISHSADELKSKGKLMHESLHTMITKSLDIPTIFPEPPTDEFLCSDDVNFLTTTCVTFDELILAVRNFAEQNGFSVARKTHILDEKRSMEIFSTPGVPQRGFFYCSMRSWTSLIAMVSEYHYRGQSYHQRKQCRNEVGNDRDR